VGDQAPRGEVLGVRREGLRPGAAPRPLPARAASTTHPEARCGRRGAAVKRRGARRRWPARRHPLTTPHQTGARPGAGTSPRWCPRQSPRGGAMGGGRRGVGAGAPARCPPPPLALSPSLPPTTAADGLVGIAATGGGAAGRGRVRAALAALSPHSHPTHDHAGPSRLRRPARRAAPRSIRRAPGGRRDLCPLLCVDLPGQGRGHRARAQDGQGV
jgi:hypothetical protein